MDVRRTIGSNVRRLRLALDLSQEVVAERMGVDRAYVSALELGRRNPTVITLWHVSEALGVTMAELVTEGPPAVRDQTKRRASKS